MRWKPILAVALGAILPFAAIEYWVRSHLFDHVSYSNSYALDLAIRDLNKRDDWRVLILGDSEARWGFDPRAIELALEAKGIDAPTLNFAMDGFSGDWARQMLDSTSLIDRLPTVRIAIVGLQMIETIEAVTPQNVCIAGSQSGGFQAPLFSSAFGKDWVDTSACDHDWTGWIVDKAESASAAIRYRRQLKQALLSQAPKAGALGLSDNASPFSYNGFQFHKPIVQNSSYEEDLRRVLVEKAEGGSAYRALPSGTWSTLTNPGGYLESLNDYFLSKDVRLVLVALPTNPALIDLKERRVDYEANSALLADFATRTGTVVVNLGIQSALDPKLDYADHRHLSGQGAAKFSRELAEILSSDSRVVSELTR